MEPFEGNADAQERPKMVVLAGPNGSGKSTVTAGLMQSGQFPRDYVNADDVAKMLEKPIASAETRAAYAAVIEPNMPDLPWYAQIAKFEKRLTREEIAGYMESGVERTDLRNAFAAILADDKRKQSLQGGGDFAFETVMSTQGKLAMFDEARGKGHDVDMVFVTTESSEINKQRVLNRVQQGGHPVDPEKIVERYDRAMAMLPAALEMVQTASVYDNSFHTPVLIARKEDGVISFPEVAMPTMEDMARRPELRKEGQLGAWYVSEQWRSDWPEAREGIAELQGSIRGALQTRREDFAKLDTDYNTAHRPFERASIQQGSQSEGRIVAVTDSHVLQYDRDNERFVAHDRSLMTRGVIPNLEKAMAEGRDVTVAYQYGPDSKLVDQNKTLLQTATVGQVEPDRQTPVISGR